MGYRSDVGIAISKKALTFLMLQNKNLFNNYLTPDQKIEIGAKKWDKEISELEQNDITHIAYIISHIKWYDSIPEIQNILDIFELLDESEYAEDYECVVVGEEYGDASYYGNHGHFFGVAHSLVDFF